MRLMHTSTLKLKQFSDAKVPPYVILSHRWGDEELIFQDFQSSSDLSSRTGYAKVKGFCHLAQSEGCDYAWLDTCCINKDSSTELGTAIRSMSRWYSDAILCYCIPRGCWSGREANARKCVV